MKTTFLGKKSKQPGFCLVNSQAVIITVLLSAQPRSCHEVVHLAIIGEVGRPEGKAPAAWFAHAFCRTRHQRQARVRECGRVINEWALVTCGHSVPSYFNFSVGTVCIYCG